MADRPRFVADEMLGSLARWLRMMGYDTAYERDRKDSAVLERATKEGRILLTRDWELSQRARDRGFYVESDDLDQQLRQVVVAFHLEAHVAMDRCTACNGQLERVPKGAIADLIPKATYETHDEFYRCRSCGKVYWKGSHWNNIAHRIDGLAPKAAQDR
jgi:uncharacterized protein with PIN domain